MKLSMVKTGIILLGFVLVFSCSNNEQKPPPPDTNPISAADSDSLLQIFEYFTQKDTSHGIISYEREINNADDVDSLVDKFYKYTSKGLEIDTTERSNPRLSLAVDFEGNTLLEWMQKMHKDSATNIKIAFGVYTPKFLNAYLRGSSLAAERQRREGRITAILVAYRRVITTKSNGIMSDTTDEFKGGYNLGGMQP